MSEFDRANTTVDVAGQLQTVTQSRRVECVECFSVFDAPAIEIAGRPLFPHRLCPSCATEFEREEQAQADAQRARLVAECLSAIPEEFASARPSLEPVVGWLEHYMAGGRRWLVLQGNVGRGKTHQAWGIWRQVAETHPERSFQAWLVADLLDAALGDDDDRALERAKDTQLLLLDDLGSAPYTDWRAVKLHQLIDARWANQRPTIITTNLPWTEQALVKQLGERIASRLLDRSRVELVTVSGPDRRRRA